MPHSSPSSSASGSRPASGAAATADFSGLWVPLVTPFRADLSVDHLALARLAERLAATGIAGFAVCGSTGEAAALDEEEQFAVLTTVARAAPSMPRIMGVSGHHLGQMLSWVRRLGEEPLAGLLVPAPNYVRPSQDGIADWFGRIAEAASAPIVVYDIPYRTGSTIARETLLALAANPRIRAVKDCGGDPAKTRALIADGRLQVLAGEDGQIFSTVAEGGSGAIAASAHLHTARFVEVLRLLQDGQLPAARALWQPLQPLIEALFADANPGPLKAALAAEGWIEDGLRPPMTPAPQALRERLAALQAGLSRR